MPVKKDNVPQAIKKRVEKRLRECIAIANETFPGYDFKLPRIGYTLRGTTAGTAMDLLYQIDLNAELLIANGQEFINRTVVHEFAHLVDGIVYPETRKVKMRWTPKGYRRSKRSVHGRTWKSIMILFGAEPSRCHSYDTSKIRKRTGRSNYVWTCGCGRAEIALGVVRHKKMLDAAPHGRGVYMRSHEPSRCGVYTFDRFERGARSRVIDNDT